MGTYTAKPHPDISPVLPDGWNFNWPAAGPDPPGYGTPQGNARWTDIADDDDDDCSPEEEDGQQTTVASYDWDSWRGFATPENCYGLSTHESPHYIDVADLINGRKIGKEGVSGRSWTLYREAIPGYDAGYPNPVSVTSGSIDEDGFVVYDGILTINFEPGPDISCAFCACDEDDVNEIKEGIAGRTSTYYIEISAIGAECVE